MSVTAPQAPEPTLDDHMPGGRTMTAKRAIVAVLVALALLVVIDGDGILRQGQKMNPGWEKDLVTGVGHPAGWIADHLPVSSAVDEMTGWLSPDDDVSSEDGSFTAAGGGGTSRVAPSAFTPEELGQRPTAKPALKTLLITGDSMTQPMDAELARMFADQGVKTIRDPKFGTGISKPGLVDWGKYAGVQAKRDKPDATVVFLGAGDTFPMKTPAGEVKCCGPAWAAEYATRARAMMASYGQGGKGKVYWMVLPVARDRSADANIRSVNQANRVAAGAFGAEVRLVDLAARITPGGKYDDALEIGGRRQIIRDPDGVHLNETGGKIAAGLVADQLRRDFTIGG
ncbi:hypothetical protein [Conexibacter sp. SYSU D00693]|uniref:DUF459 domain-containing protein n=1 Tax=Conexibacter sp. SYSU D00693 TaxID=2812560 RepID=UPI00196B266C|nr:hypothetical protein [Conexibacter sp. SYSU D00693]